MGIIYNIRCERCHTLFSHLTGDGAGGFCVACGQTADPDDPFLCPVCSAKIDPRDKDFDRQLLSTDLLG